MVIQYSTAAKSSSQRRVPCATVQYTLYTVRLNKMGGAARFPLDSYQMRGDAQDGVRSTATSLGS